MLSLLLASGLLQAQEQAPAANPAPAAEPAPAANPTPATENIAKPIIDSICMTCHGADGNNRIQKADGTFSKTDGGADSPKLAGQHPEYLFKQMREFKDATRQNAVMNGMITMLADNATMTAAAEYYSGQTLVPADSANTKDTEAFLAGKKIWQRGVLSKGLPACAACHGFSGKGISAQYPALAGQYPDYLEAQLKAFRDNTRTNDPSKMMRDIALKMTDQEIKLVSDFAAGLR